MKKNALEHIIRTTLNQLVKEQADTQPAAIETDNAPSSAVDSPFTPAEERFLGKFDAYGTTHLGIIYSPSITGIREFITRSGKDLNVTPGILLNLFRKKIIKLVPYSGFGRNDDYTIELQLSLDDVKGLGAADKEKAEKGASASGAPTGGGDMGAAAPPAENAGFVPKGNVLKETILSENKITDPDQLQRGFMFWTTLSVELPSGMFSDWDEKKILEEIKKIKNANDAILFDACGRLIFDSINSSKYTDQANNVLEKIFGTSRYPQIPKIKGEWIYTLKRLFEQLDFGAYVIAEDRDEYEKLLYTRGIGRLTIGVFYPSYSIQTMWTRYMEILNTYGKPKK
jgi:hypothetical protein